MSINNKLKDSTTVLITDLCGKKLKEIKVLSREIAPFKIPPQTINISAEGSQTTIPSDLDVVLTEEGFYHGGVLLPNTFVNIEKCGDVKYNYLYISIPILSIILLLLYFFRKKIF